MWLYGENSLANQSRIWATVRQKKIDKFKRLSSVDFTQYSPFMCLPEEVKAKRLVAETTNGTILLASKDLLELVKELTFDLVLHPKFSSAFQVADIDIQSIENAVNYWHYLSHSLEILSIVNQELKDRFDLLVRLIVPIVSTEDHKPARVLSSFFVYGAIFVSLGYRYRTSSHWAFLVDLCHELGHQTLMLYQFCDPLLVDCERPTYSGVRKVLRPGILALHALVALFFMIKTLQSLESSNVLSKQDVEAVSLKLAQLVVDYKFAISIFGNEDNLTNFGNELVNELRRFSQEI